MVEPDNDFLDASVPVVVTTDICSVIEMRDGKMAVLRDYMDTGERLDY